MREVVVAAAQLAVSPPLTQTRKARRRRSLPPPTARPRQESRSGCVFLLLHFSFFIFYFYFIGTYTVLSISIQVQQYSIRCTERSLIVGCFRIELIDPIFVVFGGGRNLCIYMFEIFAVVSA